jgi:hypothetical protein
MGHNIKLMLDELAKLWTEMEGFMNQEAAFAKRIDEVTAEDRIRDTRIANLEESAVAFEETLTDWRPEIDLSISAIKLEVSNLNSFFDRDAKAMNASQAGLLPVESAATNSIVVVNADGLVGHRVDMSHRDGGFGHVFTHTHILAMGMLHSLPLPPKLHVHLNSHHGAEFARVPSSDHEITVQIGKLPKINIPRFEGDNPKLWVTRVVPTTCSGGGMAGRSRLWVVAARVFGSPRVV